MSSIENVEISLKNEVTCALCQDIFDKPYALVPCLHTFCFECISHIPKQGYFYDIVDCPICRSRSHNQVSNFTMQNFVDIYKRSSGSEQMLPSKADGEYRAMNACRSCEPDNSTGYQCLQPISQAESGHILCGYCSEYMPARGENWDVPAINQCCSFCGVVACDAYWKCSNTSPTAKLHILRDITSTIPELLEDIESIDTLKEGHLNPVEIKYLKIFLCRSGTSWQEAWQACLDNFDANSHDTSPIIQRMTSLGREIYLTHRLPHSDIEVQPSYQLRSCYFCLPTLVNGQFYGFWKKMIETNYTKCSKEQCPLGVKCPTQWRSEAHATRLSHIEFEFSTQTQ